LGVEREAGSLKIACVSTVRSPPPKRPQVAYGKSREKDDGDLVPIFPDAKNAGRFAGVAFTFQPEVRRRTAENGALTEVRIFEPNPVVWIFSPWGEPEAEILGRARVWRV
jgi:signal peptidase I